MCSLSNALNYQHALVNGATARRVGLLPHGLWFQQQRRRAARRRRPRLARTARSIPILSRRLARTDRSSPETPQSSAARLP